MTTRVAPSTVLESAIEELLSEGRADNERLAELGRLGARLVLQRAVEEEATEFLGRARYQRTVEARGSPPPPQSRGGLRSEANTPIVAMRLCLTGLVIGHHLPARGNRKDDLGGGWAAAHRKINSADGGTLSLVPEAESDQPRPPKPEPYFSLPTPAKSDDEFRQRARA